MKILWVDDHELLCVALSEYLQTHASELSATPIDVTPVFTLARALEEVNKTPPPDLVFLDLNLDDENRGATTLEHFQAGNPSKVPVVVCTGLAPGNDQEVEILRMCMRDYAVRGILLKGGAHKKMFIGLSRILGGELWIPEEVLLRFARSTQAPSASRNEHHLGLSPREWDVGRCIARGLSGKQIARELNVSEGHVRQVSCVIYDKLRVRNRVEAALRVNAELGGGSGPDKGPS
ncbi:two-component system nitrate/nitrite response regulator NarL [Paraburkholderia youngii]|uniref:Response regulator transcription factor n=1 Tax=Paraburkholderia youngii TaxID=2782701 RepID=A0ABX2NR50_9BURK|nr:response regulator transcription factor [Paraburkholderia youngii]NVI06941.1 response regulator transcription factor [Paraburkholderia youngii]